jgi:hypothetical protein
MQQYQYDLDDTNQIQFSKMFVKMFKNVTKI